jgi:type III secretion system YscJ/HrcJ family lipoprotein
LQACGVETIVHGLEEREANQITELLAESEISTTKAAVDTGRSISYTISVPAKNKVDAIRLLNRNEMPRRADMGYTEVFKDSGLIPTAAEERAKQMAAIEGEIEKQLKLISGILDVQVQLVIPEETALRTAQDVRSPTTASVTIKYLPASGGSKPLSETQVQNIVAAGVERLTPENVVVIMSPAAPLGRSDRMMDPDRGGASGGASLAGMSARQTKMAAIALVAVIFLLCLVLAMAQIRLRTVRGRLLRLQGEIARARRKPADAPPPAAP